MTQDLERMDSHLPDVVGPRRERVSLPPLPALRKDLRGTWLAGAFVIFLFFVVGGGWAAMAPLSGAVIAAGVVSPDSSRQTIQHLEGGIIREIKVREGDQVKGGDVLVVLEGVGAQADVGAKMSRLRTLSATECRLRAEQRGEEQVQFDLPALLEMDDPEVVAAINQQRHQFQTRRADDRSQESILTQRVAQLEKQIQGAERQITGVKRQKALIREELMAVRELFEKGYERKPRLLELQRTEAGLIARQGELESEIARAREAIGEAELQIINVRVERMAEVDEQLSRVRTERIELENQVRESVDRLTRTSIMAPAAGIVLNIQFKTEGGVIGPAQPIMDIVPLEDDLIVDAKISPKDIDDVHAGLDGYVMFPSYPQRHLARIPAHVLQVSADSLEDKRTGERYYGAKVEVDRADLMESAPQIEMTPGLPAEVFITTSERTLLNYLLQPFLQVVERSFREK